MRTEQCLPVVPRNLGDLIIDGEEAAVLIHHVNTVGDGFDDHFRPLENALTSSSVECGLGCRCEDVNEVDIGDIEVRYTHAIRR
jgi:hypothetical protein